MSLKLGVCLSLGLLLVHCEPDFDSLSSGAGDAGGVAGQASAGAATSTGGSNAGGAGDGGGVAGEASAGTATSTGGSSVGSAGDGNRGGVTNQAGQTGNAAGTAEPEGGAPSAGGATGEGAAAGDGGAASGGGGAATGGGGAATGGGGTATGGEGGAPSQPCDFIHPGATHYNGFDGGLDGSGFTSSTTTTSLVTTLGATGSSEWDDAAGKSCPGALHLRAQFKGYADGTARDELAIVDLRFSDADWTGAIELHGSVRVEPATAPLGSVRFFVLSGNSFLYDSAYDDTKFRSGSWNEMVLPLVPGANFDPTRVFRIGVEIALQRQGEGTNPALSAPVDVWIDDVWVK
jgi:hypothetical protein